MLHGSAGAGSERRPQRESWNEKEVWPGIGKKGHLRAEITLKEQRSRDAQESAGTTGRKGS